MNKDDEFAREIDSHLEEEADEHTAGGMPPAEARLAARRAFGNIALIQEDVRALWTHVWLERLVQDLRYAFRSLRKNPGFAVIAMLSIALGTGANTAMFSVADRFILRPLPVYEPNEVFTIGMPSPAGESDGLSASHADFEDLSARAKALRDTVGYFYLTVGLAIGPKTAPQVSLGSLVSGNFFDAMGVRPVLGRGFRQDEDIVPGRDAVVVLSHRLWQSSFGADPAIVGRHVLINKIQFTVVGVAPEGFTGLHPIVHIEFFIPFAMWSQLSAANPHPLEDRRYRVIQIKSRLAQGITMRQAQAEISTIAADLERAYPATNQNQPFEIRTEMQARVRENPTGARMIALLALLTGCVLLVACANLAGLLTSRAPLRAREMALKSALGAGRWRLVRQLVTESLLIGAAGAVLGLAFGFAGIRLFNQMDFPTDLPISYDFQLDPRVMTLSLIVAVLSVFVFGLVPSFQTTRTNLTAVTKAADPSLAGPRRVQGRSILVVGQVAVSLVLLTLTVFVYRGIQHELGSGPGFRTDGLAQITLDPRFTGMDAVQARQFYDRVLDRVRALPGISAATLTSSAPRGWHDTVVIAPEAYHWPEGHSSAVVFASSVDDVFFSVLEIPILRGRGFDETDTADGPLVAVINDTLSRHYWPDRDPIGARFRLGANSWVRIVGVARTSTYLNIGEKPIEYIYLNRAQHAMDQMTVIARAADAPAAVNALREAVHDLDPGQTVYDAATVAQMFARRDVGGARVILRCIFLLGATGLVLALIGLYGLMSYAVNRRTRDIGIRIAIGASPAAILRMFLGQGATLACAGIAIGIPLSFSTLTAARVIYDSPFMTDTTTVYPVVIALLVVTLTAAYVPARRAARVDPNVALRHE